MGTQVLIEACILNTGTNAWAFEPLAAQLSEATGLPVSSTPAKKNYLLASDQLPIDHSEQQYYIPPAAIRTALDKREIAKIFNLAAVPSPETRLTDSLEEAKAYAREHSQKRWCLKYPISCAGAGHRMLDAFDTLPEGWPMPLVLQEFIELSDPAVYRTYGVSGEIFGWIARRFPAGKKPSPWVAHARGARYESCGELPAAARETAKKALVATNLLNRFGCVDLIQDASGRWLALEVGTDGGTSHVDRDLGNPPLEEELTQRLAAAVMQFADSEANDNTPARQHGPLDGHR